MSTLQFLRNSNLWKEKAYINGEWINSIDQKTLEVENPSTGELIGEVPFMTEVETRLAIQSAEKAFAIWSRIPAKDRSILLRRLYDLMMQNKEDLAKILTLEQGKVYTESISEIVYAASFVEWFAEEGKRTYGDIIPSHRKDTRIAVLKQPVGVVGAITPWNFPSSMITRKIAPALAAGCTVIIKPSEITPFSALALCSLIEEAGFPPGVVNIVMGDPQRIGMELTTNPIVRKISFTGSVRVGKLLMQQCASTVKKLSLELGGNAPFIVFEDANIEEAVKGAIISKFRNSGQTCVCTNRFFVQGTVYNEFLATFKNAVEKLKVGDGFGVDSQIGPIIHKNSVVKLQGLIDDALQKKAKLITGGMEHPLGANFFTPTILSEVTPQMRLFKEECFGPIAPIVRFYTEDEVIQLANNTEYGLAAYFYTRDIGRVWRVAERLEYGMVGVNEGIISSEQVPFGGVKESGLGREGSKYGMDEYLEMKYLCMGGI